MYDLNLHILIAVTISIIISLIFLYRCPVYYNLPTDCTLVRQTGECCLKPVCNFHQKIVATESSGKGTTPSGISNIIQFQLH